MSFQDYSTNKLSWDEAIIAALILTMKGVKTENILSFTVQSVGIILIYYLYVVHDDYFNVTRRAQSYQIKLLSHQQ